MKTSHLVLLVALASFASAAYDVITDKTVEIRNDIEPTGQTRKREMEKLDEYMQLRIRAARILRKWILTLIFGCPNVCTVSIRMSLLTNCWF